MLHVHAPARLHMGFIDVCGVLGRRFGSIGVALNELGIRMRLARAERLSVKGAQYKRAEGYARLFLESVQIGDGVEIVIDQAIPEHAGLGSGTQMALSIGVGLSRLFELNKTLDELVPLMGRGHRSGIGIGAFCHGGLVVDGGRSDKTVIPPVISQLLVPDDWRFILVMDTSVRGIHGEYEAHAFDALPEFPRHQVAQLSHLVFMRALPAVVEGDLRVFGDVITELQASVGDHFAAVQGGRFTSQLVEQVVLWLGSQGAVGLGQSSWGPTGFCMVDGSEQAKQMIHAARQRYADSCLELMSVSVCKTGSTLKVDSEATETLQLTEFG